MDVEEEVVTENEEVSFLSRGTVKGVVKEIDRPSSPRPGKMQTPPAAVDAVIESIFCEMCDEVWSDVPEKRRKVSALRLPGQKGMKTSIFLCWVSVREYVSGRVRNERCTYIAGCRRAEKQSC